MVKHRKNNIVEHVMLFTTIISYSVRHNEKFNIFGDQVLVFNLCCCHSGICFKCNLPAFHIIGNKECQIAGDDIVAIGNKESSCCL